MRSGVQDRKLLVVTYYFPPDAAVGGLRPSKFAKHLRDFGWDPIVLTVGESHAEVRDPARLVEVASIPVVRTAVWPTLAQLGARVGRRLRPPGGAGVAAPVARSAGAAGGPGQGRVRAEVRRLLISLLQLPDREVGWLVPAIVAGLRVIRREGVEWVLTSSPPRTTALVGLCLARLARVRLASDLRDPWHSTAHKPADQRTAFSDGVERRLEAALLRRSNLVLTTTDRYAAHLRGAYPWLPAPRVQTIPNGYDASDFADVEAQRSATFTVAYLGNLYFGRNPDDLLHGVRRFLDRRPLAPLDFRVRFIGRLEGDMPRRLSALVEQLDLARFVEVSPPVPYRAAISVMKGADVLVLFAPAPGHVFCVPTKAFEYMAARRPVLCFTSEGATADLFEATGAGIVVPPGDVERTAEALDRLYAARAAGLETAPGCDPAAFERRRLAGELARLLDAAGAA